MPLLGYWIEQSKDIVLPLSFTVTVILPFPYEPVTDSGGLGFSPYINLCAKALISARLSGQSFKLVTFEPLMNVNGSGSFGLFCSCEKDGTLILSVGTLISPEPVGIGVFDGDGDGESCSTYNGRLINPCSFINVVCTAVHCNHTF